MSFVSSLFLLDRVVRHGLVDLLGATWECQSFSRAGLQQGAMDARFQILHDLIRIINFFQRKHVASLVNILENTFSGGKCTPAVAKAG